jgi:hypothetical protein
VTGADEDTSDWTLIYSSEEEILDIAPLIQTLNEK